MKEELKTTTIALIEKRKRTDAFCLIDIHENGRSKPFSPPRQRTCQRRRCTVIFHGACSSPTRGTLRAMNDRRAGQARRTGEGKSKERRRRYSAEHGAHRRSRRRGHQAVRGGAPRPATARLGAAARLDGIGGGGGYRGGGGGPPLSLLNGPATARPVFGQFFIFIFKKTKFQKYISNREIFKNGCLSPP